MTNKTHIPRLKLEGVSKRYPSRRNDAEVFAIDDISFHVDEGEFVTIVGPSGCGKSTALNLIAGLIEPSSGNILIDGHEVENRRRHFGYMFQKDLLFPWRTVCQNVALGIEVLGTPKGKARQDARAILTEFDLGTFADNYPAQLSGGMRQRVALMRTLLCKRETLLLDEPLGALDALTRAVMQEWLLGIWERERRTILLITHDIDEAIFLSGRVLTMSARPGRIKGELAIDLERPRDHRITTSRRFMELKKIVVDLIYDESVKAATT